MTSVECEYGDYYMDNRLYLETEKVRKAVLVKDKDRFFVVDGAEGVGKSVFAQQLAYRLDPSFNLDRIVFKPKDFRNAIIRAKKGQAIIFDEAFTGLSSRSAVSRINKMLVSLMMEMRQKNLFVIIVLPTFFLLDKYVALWRSVGLFHVYTKKGKRGFWCYYNRGKKKVLYLKGKQDYSYFAKGIPRSGFKGRFYDKYTVDEKLYRAKKRLALGEEELNFDSPVYNDRNILLKVIREKLHLTYRDMESLLRDYGMNISYSQISRGIKEVK